MSNLCYCRDLKILHDALMTTGNADHFDQGLIALIDIVHTMQLKNDEMEKKINVMRDAIAGMVMMNMALKRKIVEIEKTANSAANVASCLANGIKPD